MNDFLSTHQPGADQKNNIYRFFEDALNKKGTKLTISRVEDIPSLEEDVLAPGSESEEEEIIDISSVTISFEDGPRKGANIELDVNFQSGNVISLLFSRNEKNLIGLREVQLPEVGIQELNRVVN